MADEINRASPRTQSALLQAMEEKSISIENEIHSLSEVFFVIATQNPREQVGTSALPESQLDRFLFKFAMAKLSPKEEIELLRSGPQHQKVEHMTAQLKKSDILHWREACQKVEVPQTILEWVADFLHMSRQDHHVSALGTRVGIDFILALKAYSLIHERAVVRPEDVSILSPYVFGHRLFGSKRLSVAEEWEASQKWLHGKSTTSK